MKIAVTGKGGVGKTTISAVLARLYAEEGKKVFAVDVDPDANLGLALGFSEEELLMLLEEKTDQIQKLTDENQQWQELAQKLNSENRLLQKQTVHEGHLA